MTTSSLRLAKWLTEVEGHSYVCRCRRGAPDDNVIPAAGQMVD